MILSTQWTDVLNASNIVGHWEQCSLLLIHPNNEHSAYLSIDLTGIRKRKREHKVQSEDVSINYPGKFRISISHASGTEQEVAKLSKLKQSAFISYNL